MRAFFLFLSLFMAANSSAEDPAYYGTIHIDPNQGRNLKKYKNLSANADMVAGSMPTYYRQFEDRTTVPGFISTTPITHIATVIGPDINGTSVRVQDTIYLRWMGAPGPRIGDLYHTYMPRLTLQNVNTPTDFIIHPASERNELPKDYRLAGYFYESSATIKITKIENGAVEALVVSMTSPIGLGDHIMPYLAPIKKVERMPSPGFQLVAAIVSGSPPDRLSTTKRSYIYLNRGTRDGVRVGRMFEAVEHVPLMDSVNGYPSEVSFGEVVVVYATESFATAMITEQFDVIRIGSLLRAKQNLTPIKPRFPSNRPASYKIIEDINKPSIPQTPAEKISEIRVPQLPKEPESMLSELDALERSLKLNELSVPEKDRLNRLNKQASREAEKELTEIESGELSSDGSVPNIPSLDNSFKRDANASKKADPKKKTKKKKNEEEELNLLMMQN